MPPKAKPTKKKTGDGRKSQRKRSPRCRTCGKSIRVPEGWSQGPAIRRHYWAKHRETMARGSK